MSCCSECAAKEIEMNEPVSCAPCMMALGADDDTEPLSGLDAQTHLALEAALGREIEARGLGATESQAEAASIASLDCAPGEEAACAFLYRLYKTARFRAALQIAALERADLALPSPSGDEIVQLGALASNPVEVQQYIASRILCASVATSCPLGTSTPECVGLFGGMGELLKAILIALLADELADVRGRFFTLPVYFEPEAQRAAEPSDDDEDDEIEEPATARNIERSQTARQKIDIALSALRQSGTGSAPATPSAPPPDPGSSPGPGRAPQPSGTMEDSGSRPNDGLSPPSSRPSAPLPPFYRGGSDFQLAVQTAGEALKIGKGAIKLAGKSGEASRGGRKVAVYRLNTDGASLRLPLRQWQILEKHWRAARQARASASRTPDLLPAAELAQVAVGATRDSRDASQNFSPKAAETYAMGRARWEHFIIALWYVHRRPLLATTIGREELDLASGNTVLLDPPNGLTHPSAACSVRATSDHGDSLPNRFPPSCRFQRNNERTLYSNFRRDTLAKIPTGIGNFAAFEAAVFNALSRGGRFEAKEGHQVIPPPPRSSTSTMSVPLAMDVYEDAMAWPRGAATFLTGKLKGAMLALRGVWGGELNVYDDGYEPVGDDGIVDAIFEVIDMDAYAHDLRSLPAIEPLSVDDRALALRPFTPLYGDDDEMSGKALFLMVLLAGTLVSLAAVGAWAYVVPQAAPHFADVGKTALSSTTGLAGSAIEAGTMILPNLGRG